MAIESQSGNPIGFLIIATSGILNASFALPLRFSKVWQWENSWFVFSALSLLIFPLSLVYALAGPPWSVYRDIPHEVLLPALICGFIWGLAQVAFGIGISLVGMAMSFAIVGGLAGALGSVAPLAFLHPEELGGQRGIALLVSIAVLAAGLWLYVIAARKRDFVQRGAATVSKDFRKGLAVCVFTGIAGSALNLGFALSGPLATQLSKHGLPATRAGLCVWAVILGSAAIPNLAYSAYLLVSNKTSSNFGKSGRDWSFSFAMAVLWISGTLGYGTGATIAGHFGNSLGYALYMSLLLLWSTCLGVLTGEWRNSSPTARRYMGTAVGLIVISALILGFSAVNG